MKSNDKNATGFSDLDQSLLSDIEQYEIYYRYLPDYLDNIAKHYHQIQKAVSTSPFEVESVVGAAKRMKETVCALKFKYLFDPKEALRVDLTHSGFPNYFEIQAIDRDYKVTNKESALEKLEMVKKEFLNHIFKHKKINTKYQQLISRFTYITMLKYDLIFKPFEAALEFKQLEWTDEYVLYSLSWSCYSMTLNRPQVYIMEFEYHNDGKSIYDNDEHLNIVSDRARSANWKIQSHLLNIITHIDQLVPFIRPKKLTRIDIGPYYTQFKKDNAVFTSLLKKLKSDKDFIMCLTRETIDSIGQKKVNGSLSKVLQVYDVPQEIPETKELNCSRVDKFIFAPHSVVQMLYALYEKEVIMKLACPPIIVNKKN